MIDRFSHLRVLLLGAIALSVGLLGLPSAVRAGEDSFLPSLEELGKEPPPEVEKAPTPEEVSPPETVPGELEVLPVSRSVKGEEPEGPATEETKAWGPPRKMTLSPSACVRPECKDQFAKYAFVHQPVAEGKCNACHQASGLVRGEVACVECHKQVEPFHGNKPDSDRDRCLGCHDPHGGATKALWARSEELICRSCHARVVRVSQPASSKNLAADAAQPEKKVSEEHRHGPLVQGRCSPCHPSHERDTAKLLKGNFPKTAYTRYERSMYTACFGTCHDASLVEEAKTKTATQFRNDEDNLHFRHVARAARGGRRGESCTLCHAPHRAKNSALMQEWMKYGDETLTLRFELTKNGGKCATSCHVPLEYDRNKAAFSPMKREKTETQ